MRKNEPSDNKNDHIDKILKTLSARRRAPIFGFVILLILYIIATIFLQNFTGSQGAINIFGAALSKNSLAGVFASLANICVIFLVIFYGKSGYYTSLIILLSQYPVMVIKMLRNHSIMGLPGFFTNLFTILVVITLHLNNEKINKYQQRLQDQAVTDGLTGMPNRFACSELIKDLIKVNKKFAVVSIDLNNFKSINDTMGHNTGNKVLKAISERWMAAVDSDETDTLDLITRLGGDEFALVIRNYKSEEDIENTIKYFEKVLEEKLTIDECDYYMSASFGYAKFPEDADTVDMMLSCADAAMYDIKLSNSSNRIRRFTPELLKKDRSLEIERKIRTALENGTFYFNLQPQYDINHKLRGFEALARLRDTDGSNISPAEFIPVAEKVGIIDKVDLNVFMNAAKFFGNLIKETDAEIMLSVNVSVRHLMKNDFLDEIRDTLDSCGIPADRLEIEITESVMIDSAEKALDCINSIKDMGVKIAIDDFGTGYSSLSYLNKFPANLLKIDKSFIDKMNTGDSSKQYVATIISIGHIMNFDVISEGVEQAEQLETLRSIGCDYIQGYIWGRPLSPEEARKLVINSK